MEIIFENIDLNENYDMLQIETHCEKINENNIEFFKLYFEYMNNNYHRQKYLQSNVYKICLFAGMMLAIICNPKIVFNTFPELNILKFKFAIFNYAIKINEMNKNKKNKSKHNIFSDYTYYDKKSLEFLNTAP